jgi:hypothetical protein
VSGALSQVGGDTDFDLNAMREFTRGLPELYLLLTEEREKPELENIRGLEKLAHPVGLRLRLPGNASVTAVQMNGRALPESKMNGYSVWDTPNGFRMVQADLSPDFCAGSRFVMMVRYE